MSLKRKKAIVLLSGGLDSATTLYYAQDQGYQTISLIFDYGQRHRQEIKRAQAIAREAKSVFRVIKISLPWKGSSLLDKNMPLPHRRTIKPDQIPTTYVPARNIIFLSFAVSLAEAEQAQAVFIGANAIDYSGYPDCRPEFFSAFQQVLRRGLKTGVERHPIKIHTPLIRKTKAEIIRLGLRLNVPYHLTWSCYKGGARPCGQCESCRLRQKGFLAVGIQDPVLNPLSNRKKQK